MNLAKWCIVYVLAMLIGDYVLSKLFITNGFYTIIFTALIISVTSQAVRSHDHEHEFKMKWFVFYFLVYSLVIWVIRDYLFTNEGFVSSIVVGFALAIMVVLLQKMNLRSKSLPWISIVILLVLLVGNLESLQVLSLNGIIPLPQNTSGLTEDKQICPTINYPFGNSYVVKFSKDLNPATIGPVLNELIDTNVWRIENNIRSCYKGRYKDQYPNWYYCDDMIVSRWETSNSGTINYRWYTAVATEWKPTSDQTNPQYVLQNFKCEGGQRVTVERDKTNYYVHVSRDGTAIQVEY